MSAAYSVPIGSRAMGLPPGVRRRGYRLYKSFLETQLIAQILASRPLSAHSAMRRIAFMVLYRARSAVRRNAIYPLVQSLSRACSEPVKSLSRACPEPVQSLSRACQEPVQSLSRAFYSRLYFDLRSRFALQSFIDYRM
jgi:hypothetical protein